MDRLSTARTPQILATRTPTGDATTASRFLTQNVNDQAIPASSRTLSTTPRLQTAPVGRNVTFPPPETQLTPQTVSRATSQPTGTNLTFPPADIRLTLQTTPTDTRTGSRASTSQDVLSRASSRMDTRSSTASLVSRLSDARSVSQARATTSMSPASAASITSDIETRRLEFELGGTVLDVATQEEKSRTHYTLIPYTSVSQQVTLASGTTVNLKPFQPFVKPWVATGLPIINLFNIFNEDLPSLFALIFELIHADPYVSTTHFLVYQWDNGSCALLEKFVNNGLPDVSLTFADVKAPAPTQSFFVSPPPVLLRPEYNISNEDYDELASSAGTVLLATDAQSNTPSLLDQYNLRSQRTFANPIDNKRQTFSGLNLLEHRRGSTTLPMLIEIWVTRDWDDTSAIYGDYRLRAAATSGNYAWLGDERIEFVPRPDAIAWAVTEDTHKACDCKDVLKKIIHTLFGNHHHKHNHHHHHPHLLFDNSDDQTAIQVATAVSKMASHMVKHKTPDLHVDPNVPTKHAEVKFGPFGKFIPVLLNAEASSARDVSTITSELTQRLTRQLTDVDPSATANTPLSDEVYTDLAIRSVQEHVPLNIFDHLEAMLASLLTLDNHGVVLNPEQAYERAYRDMEPFVAELPRHAFVLAKPDYTRLTNPTVDSLAKSLITYSPTAGTEFLIKNYVLLMVPKHLAIDNQAGIGRVVPKFTSEYTLVVNDLFLTNPDLIPDSYLRSYANVMSMHLFINVSDLSDVWTTKWKMVDMEDLVDERVLDRLTSTPTATPDIKTALDLERVTSVAKSGKRVTFADEVRETSRLGSRTLRSAPSQAGRLTATAPSRTMSRVPSVLEIADDAIRRGAATIRTATNTLLQGTTPSTAVDISLRRSSATPTVLEMADDAIRRGSAAIDNATDTVIQGSTRPGIVDISLRRSATPTVLEMADTAIRRGSAAIDDATEAVILGATPRSSNNNTLFIRTSAPSTSTRIADSRTALANGTRLSQPLATMRTTTTQRGLTR